MSLIESIKKKKKESIERIGFHNDWYRSSISSMDEG